MRTRPTRRPRYSQLLTVSFALLTAVTTATLIAQIPPSAAQPPDTAETLARVTALRDAFIARVHAAGSICPIAAPTIVVDHVPSFGNYDDATNTLHTTDWTLLDPDERALFLHLAGPGADEAAAHANFERGVHRWVFTHELGHWWQACSHALNQPPYQVEFGANRIALAYWREVDPDFAAKLVPVFQGILDHMPDPVPAGQPVEAYFNQHYPALGPTPAYRWFQSRMIITASAETPSPTFAQVLTPPKP